MTTERMVSLPAYGAIEHHPDIDLVGDCVKVPRKVALRIMAEDCESNPISPEEYALVMRAARTITRP